VVVTGGLVPLVAALRRIVPGNQCDHSNDHQIKYVGDDSIADARVFRGPRRALPGKTDLSSNEIPSGGFCSSKNARLAVRSAYSAKNASTRLTEGRRRFSGWHR
jgi:hypothetical protein